MLYGVNVVWRKRTTGEFLIQHWAKHPELSFANAGFGEAEPVAAAEMWERGLEIVTRSLDEFFSRTEIPRPESPGSAIAKNRARQRTQHEVFISRKSGELLFEPMRHYPNRGTFGEPEDRSTLPLPTTQEEFYDALMAAFERLY